MNTCAPVKLSCYFFTIFFVMFGASVPAWGQTMPFPVSFYYPTNGQSYTAPTNVGLHAEVLDSNVVETVQYYYSGTNSIGNVTNTNGVVLTNGSQANPFFLDWTNVPAGTYSLTAVATDSTGTKSTSAPITIYVTNPVPHPEVYIYSPTNNSKFIGPTNVTIYARAAESGGTIASVEFLENSLPLGVVSNSASYTNISTEPLYAFTWTNVPPGNYALTAIVTDLSGNMATSTVVNISVVSNTPPPVPFLVSFWYPTNGQTFVAPANVGVHAKVTDSNVVTTVQYFENGTNIGIVTNTSDVLLTNSTQSNPFFLDWSNVPPGMYEITAVATDTAGATATSAPVTIWVVSNALPVVSIYAPDPVAIEGTNWGPPYTPPTPFTNYYSGTNTATFLVRRDSGTNVDLTVNYSIGGTASNGVDYALIVSNVTIAAGQRYALITIVPLEDNDTNRLYDTVILSLLASVGSTNVPESYTVGSPSRAGAIILEDDFLPMLTPQIHSMADSSIHVSLPGTNGLNFSVEVSTDMVNWQAVCTNTVLKGSAQYVDPGNGANGGLFYRIVPAGGPPNY